MLTQQMTLERLEQQVTQLPLPEQLKLVAHVSVRLSSLIRTIPLSDEPQVQRAQLDLAKRLLAECEDIVDDAQGEFDAVKTIRRMREERVGQICQSGA